MIVKRVSAMRFNELKSKGNHSDKYCEYKWYRNTDGKRYCMVTDRHGDKYEIRQRNDDARSPDNAGQESRLCL